MEVAVGAARWVVGRALSPVTDGLLESWAACSELGPNINALKLELLYAQGILDNARGKDLRSPALRQLLLELRQLAYAADDVLDELEYFRIQDELDGTYEATNADERGLVRGLVLNTRHTARAVAGKLKLSGATHAIRKHLLCNASATTHAPKLKFDRVEMSKRMTVIEEQLRPVCAKVATILDIELLGTAIQQLQILAPNNTTTQAAASNRSISTPLIIEPKLYGREKQKKDVVADIIGKYCGKNLTVLSVYGPGGIGKTIFIQHIYEEVKSHFDVPIWICVSLSFNANRLLEEIVKTIPKVKDEKKNISTEELIEIRLHSKRFLLVLDDMWTYHEDEWKKLLAPFKKGGTEGNMVIVTTRIPEVAKSVGTINGLIKLERLEPREFMHLFKDCVFNGQPLWEVHPELHQVGAKIVEKLKGFPLAVKTVGRLLRNDLSLDHWTRVLESKEWELQTNIDDIMPALKLSFDFLSFPLQQCFFHCGLFPEDYKFQREELIHLWIGLGLIVTNGQNKRAEDIGLGYLIDLVNRGFFELEAKNYDTPIYVIHDLLHELALNVSSDECLSINSSNVRSIQIPMSVRHLSILINDADVKNRISFENCKRDLTTLRKRLKVQNLHSLMLFGAYHGSFAKTFGDLFMKAKSLRVILLSRSTFNVQDLFHNFSKLLHLRYLRFQNYVHLPNSISRFYHLLVLDIQECFSRCDFLKDMSRLVNMHNFLVREDSMHSKILEVGKLKQLRELRRFEVKKETYGFELKQLGELLELRGSLGIYNLENVHEVKEADAAKLANINHLCGLKLYWDNNRSDKDPKQEELIIESLKPHNNIRELCISGHGGTTLPTWLGPVDFSINNLESLHLESVAWNILPLPGKLCLVNEHGGEYSGGLMGQGFQNLKSLKLIDIPTLKRWHGHGTYDMLPHLQTLIVRGCSELIELLISHSACSQFEHVENMNCFPELHTIKISSCPKLLSLPPIPWTPALSSVEIDGVGCSFQELNYSTGQDSRSILKIKGKDALDCVFWNVLAFNNLTELHELKISNCPPLSLDYLKKLSCMKTLEISNSSNILCPIDSEREVQYELSVEYLNIESCDASGRELTQLLSHFTKLSKLEIQSCKNITGLGVVERKKTTIVQSPSASEKKMDDTQIIEQPQEHIGGGEVEIEASTAAEEGLLLLPSQIQELRICFCKEISFRSISHDNGTTTSGRGGLQGLSSLQSLRIWNCPKLLCFDSSYPSHSPFPTSLQKLNLDEVEGMETLPPFSNLLTELEIDRCDNLRGDGLWSLLAQGHVIKLTVRRCPKFFVGSEPSRLNEQDLRHSSVLRELETNDIVGLLSVPVCRLLSSSLSKLVLCSTLVERFTEEQEMALRKLVSLEELRFEFCDRIQSLPAGLSELPKLKIIWINFCDALRSLDGLPSSLQELTIWSCPAIRSLPKDGFPSSLITLNVSVSENDELIRHCRKLTGTIPIMF